MSEWHIMTGEFPPGGVGGVAGYTSEVALGLVAAGDTVHVWCPGDERVAAIERGVIVHRSMGNWGRRALRESDQQLAAFRAPRRLLVQWVPHAFGFRSLNLGFCMWLWKRARVAGDRLEIMVHEASLAFGEGSARRNAAALIHRVMTIVLLRAATRVWVAIPEWERRWRAYAGGRDVEFRWLPVPSNIPRAADPSAAAAIRAAHVGNHGCLIGQFGTQSAHQSALWTEIAERTLGSRPDDAILFIGAGSDTLRRLVVEARQALAGRIHSTGPLEPADVSRHLAACDVLVQPYPDGVNTRRGTVMAALAHGRPVVTTIGRHSEALWADSGAVVLAEPSAAAIATAVRDLLDDPGRRAALEGAARALYDARFDLRHTIGKLRGGVANGARAGAA